MIAINGIEIKKLLEKEIIDGNINWSKFEKKIHVLLAMVDNKFETIREDTGEKVVMSMADAFTFPICFSDGTKKCYKIYSPRFREGKLVCYGLQIGFYDLKGQPYFPYPMKAY